MVGSNKILTVSYGTFSCTLEGFDDPFSTMRSIAEYFRDLAADDRYFGAEPPTPDAEMLQSIAEKEIQRRVDARVQENGLVLTQMDDVPSEAEAPTAQSVAPQAEMPAPYDMMADTGAMAYQPSFEDEIDMVGEDLPQASDVTHIEANPATAETIAEKLNRIRAVVDTARGDTQSQEQAADSDLEHVAQDVTDALAAEDNVDEGDATEVDIADALAAFDEDAEEDTATQDEPVEAISEDVAPELEADKDGAEPEEGAETPEEPVAKDEPEDITADEHADDNVAPVLADEDDASDQADDTPTYALSPDADAWSAVEVTTGADEQIAEDHDEGTQDAEPIARVVKLSAEGQMPYIADEETLAEAVDRDFDQDVDPADVTDLGKLDDADDETSSWEEAAADDVAAEADDHMVAENEDEASLEIVAETERDEVSEEDDVAESIRAAIGASDVADAASESDHAKAESEETADHNEDHHDDALAAGAMAARDRLGSLPESEGQSADVERLLEKTNDQMEESEGSRRRSAIAHLKAAVAATKADRLLKRVTSREKSEAEEQTQYRDDLAQVVRPRRPSASEGSSERPEPIEEGKSPLMLVSELRVDEDGNEAAATAPIMPRRVSMEDAADAAAEAESSSYEDGASFADFAEKMGAIELPDLLEAAAAYAAFVENRPHFSRPQLMKRVARHDQSGEFTREAGLRSFGQLLRQGKIRKLKRGQFTVADTTRFNPEARIAGE